MKRWAVLTVLLYGVVLALLTVPVVFVLFLGKSEQGAVTPLMSLADVLSWYKEWGYWVWLAVMLAGQALLLVVPVGLAERRPPARRGLWVPTLTASFLVANVFFGAVLSIACAALGDGAGSALEWLGKRIFENPLWSHPTQQVGQPTSGNLAFWCAIASTFVLLWIIWGVVFYRYARADDPEALTQRATRWLLRGSILELLVAVPSHVVVRHRNDCCAPIGTFWGIVTGISIMLLSFGPGVFFLFVERCQRLRPQTGPPTPADTGPDKFQ